MQDGPWRGATRAAARRRPAGRPGRASTGRKRRGAACAWGASLSALGGDDRGDGERRRRARPRADAAGERRGCGCRPAGEGRKGAGAAAAGAHGMSLHSTRTADFLVSPGRGPRDGACQGRQHMLQYRKNRHMTWRDGKSAAEEQRPCVGAFDNSDMASFF